MEEFPDVPNAAQWRQQTAGDLIAIHDLLQALIRTHPARGRLSAVFEEVTAETARIFLTAPALQGDDGCRAAYSAAVRGFRDTMLRG